MCGLAGSRCNISEFPAHIAAALTYFSPHTFYFFLSYFSVLLTNPVKGVNLQLYAKTKTTKT